MYSALKVDGQKLCDLARKGVEVERQGRKITVYSLNAEKINGEIILRILCSRGTYIRTLIEDIGEALG
jgi:tRNA pseudouridine55 synthase